MLDQNITTLLATVIGGLLTALGGFLNSRLLERTSKRKEVRNILEKIYKISQEIKYLSTLSIQDPESSSEIEKRIHDIEYLVNFYIHPLETSLEEYRTNLVSIQKEKLREGTLGKEEIEIATKKFQAAVINLFRKRGYSYF